MSEVFWQCHCPKHSDSGASPVSRRAVPTIRLDLRIHSELGLLSRCQAAEREAERAKRMAMYAAKSHAAAAALAQSIDADIESVR